MVILGLALMPMLTGQACAPSAPEGGSGDSIQPDDGSTSGGDSGTGDNSTNDGSGDTSGGTTSSDRATLNVVKLAYYGTTERGPAVGDGVLAFDADGGTWLAWLAAGQTTATAVSAPPSMGHDRNAFAFGGKKLVVRDRYSGSLYVYNTETQTVKAMPAASINMGGIAGPNYWAVDGNLVATINASTTTADGAGKRIKVVDISNINAFTITPYNLSGMAEPDAIDIDADNDRMVVRAGDTLYVYTLSTPAVLPERLNLSGMSGAGDSSVWIRNGLITFFDDNDYFSILRLSDSTVGSPARNPARASRGSAMNGGRWAYFVTQTADDGSTIDQYNRAIIGAGEDLTNVIDPPGTYVNGSNSSNGRVGYGATLAITPNGRYVFVAGETAVGVDTDERLCVSVDGSAFLMVADATDSLNAMRATGVAASDNMVAFLIPYPGGASSDVAVAYATLSP
jgi:hypothetical protein